MAEKGREDPWSAVLPLVLDPANVRGGGISQEDLVR